jgi:glutaminase
MQLPIQDYLSGLHSRFSPLHEGEVASYIPELAKANPDWFGICVVTVDGYAYTVGDSDQNFTMQSISKPFVYAAALADRGKEAVLRKVGVEPSGDAFNSISLDPGSGAPLNPMINAGAIATTSLVAGDTVEAQWRRIEESMAAFVGHGIEVDEAVYRSESETGFRNRAIAWMLKNFGVVDGDPMSSLENYFRQCSILVSCRDLAFMAATLANCGVHPVTGKRALPDECVEPVLSVMATCGMYDYAGSWLYEVGMPAKSGVGGGIIAVLPGRCGIGVFSPRLDAKGNSSRGIAVCRQLSQDLGLHVFARTAPPQLVLNSVYTAADSPSRRQPSREKAAYLAENAHRIKFLSLQGMLAMDGAEYVIRQMQHLAGETDSFILDMHQVTGLSDSGARMLHQARSNLHAEGIAVVFSRVRGRTHVEDPLRRALPHGDRGFLHFEDNDLAAEWCENRLFKEGMADPREVASLADFPLFRRVPAEMIAATAELATRQRFAANQAILAAGQQGDGRIYFIKSGTVSVLVPVNDSAHQRIMTLGPGMSFGEMMILGQAVRSASVHADSDVVCWVLTARDLDRVSETFPLLKITVLENLAQDLADKLRQSNRLITALAS